jgi:hypothetical protein
MPLSKIRRFILVAGLCILAQACASRPVPQKFQAPREAERGTGVPEGGKTVSASENEKRIRAAVEKLLGRKADSAVVINGKNFTLDCTGTVRAVFYSLQLDVARDFPQFSGNGVKRLYETLRRQNLLHREVYPQPGDIIFWDNTYDMNNDGNRNNDPLTHAGIVVGVEEDGTIHYVHSHVRQGIVIEVMNLRSPRDYYNSAGKIINTALALGSGISRPKNPEHWLSGDLWNSFGSVFANEDYFLIDKRLAETVNQKKAGL